MQLRLIFSLFIIAAPVFFAGCSKAPAGPVVAVVNGTPIPAKDFEKELSLRAAQDPSFKMTQRALEEQLDLMINRKLLIEEAIDRKLSEDERFKTSIRIFWEQTLIRLLMDSLTKEIEQSVNASDEEVKNYYAKLNSRVSFRIKRGDDKAVVEAARAALEKGTAVEWDEELGPVTFDNLNSPMLEEAFDFKQGESRIFERDGLFFLVYVPLKETAAPPAFESIQDKIKANIKQRKQTDAFEKWFNEKKGKADIKMKLENFNERSSNALTAAPPQ